MTRAMLLWSAISFLGFASLGCAAEPERPSVLFCGGVHNKYVTKPLVEMGIDVDACGRAQLAERLASGKYNVVVVSTMNDAERKAVDAFLAKGGGVLVCNPAESRRAADWTGTNEWLAALGARPRWEVIQDSDKDNVARDVMGCALSFSDQVLAPVKEGVRGVLTLMWHGTTGCEPPMSFDLSKDWTPLVRGAKTMTSRPSKRNDEIFQPWIPKEGAAPSPVLLAAREVGKGRMAVLAIRYYWIFTPGGNCPTTEAMLTAGASNRPSDWLRVFANSFAYLAEPSMKAGLGGAGTPEAVLNPPVQVWEPPAITQWAEPGPMQDQSQVVGLIGARTSLSSGKGTVEDYVKAAKGSGLQFIAFLEDSLKMDQAKWDQLVKACEAASDDKFAAVPGLTYEDAQGNHLYAFADEVKFPKPSMVLADGRLASNRSGRTKALFEYVNELMRQHIISGYWQHRNNELHFADYKLYNSFPIYSSVDGKPMDDAFDEWAYLQSIGGCHAALAFEIMTSPDQVAKRAKDGWRVVWYRSVKDLLGKWHHGAWSFHGMMSQYVTSGPKLLVWQAPNRLVNPSGLWWRPDQWEFRVLLRASSEVGLKSVSLYDGERLFRRWMPGGEKTFETTLILSNCQQMALFPVVEDVNGGKAIGMQSWNRNCIMEEFFCSDRCNFLGNARLRTRDGRQTWTQVSFQGNMGITPSKGRLNLEASPAVCLTMDSPSLPIDGRPMGFPTAALRFQPAPPGEHPIIFAYPQTYLVGPEIAVGQTDHKLVFDPKEKGATETRIGHPYEQPQHGGVHGNAWGAWHRLVPTKLIAGYSRIYACNWLPETFRIGWHETDVTLKEDVDLGGKPGYQVMYASMPGWVFYQGDKPIATPDMKGASGEFKRGIYAVLEHSGGSVVALPIEGPLHYNYYGKGSWGLNYVPEGGALKKGDRVRFRIGFAGAGGGTTTAKLLEFARKFGVANPGTAGYAPEFKSGKQIDNYLLWRVDAEGAGVDVHLPKADMPGFLPASIENLNDNWSVQLLDRARPWPNHRALPIRDGRAFAQLDLVEADLDLFLGHPVTADNKDVKLSVSWMMPGKWFVEVNNPTDKTVGATLTSSPGWTLFDFKETVQLAPGGSRTWTVEVKEK